MKFSTKYIVIGLFAITAIFSACASGPAGKATVSPTEKNVKLGKGTVQVINFGNVTLHAYRTNDYLGDESYILEGKKSLVAIELPAFHSNLGEYISYVKGLNKPLTDVMLSYHPTGADYLKEFSGVKIHATAASIKAWSDGGAIKGLVDSFTKTFGGDFDPSLPDVKADLAEGKTSIGGFDFVVSGNGDAYEIEIPAIRSIYVHMLGADVHSILASTAHMDATIDHLKSFKAKNYTYILSSHYVPETLAAVDAKIAYVEKAKSIASTAKTADEFIKEMKANFPKYQGENYLAMTAGMLYK